MDHQIIKNELISDPLSRGYSSMTDQEVADDLNTVYRTRNVLSFTGNKLIAATNSTEYIALSDTKKLQWLSLCAIGNLDPFGPAVAIAIDIWGSGSTTISTLQDLRVQDISRAVELVNSEVNSGDIQYSRSII